MARWWNGRHAVVRRPCPPWREGSSPSLVTAQQCPVLRLQAPALRRLVGQFDSGMVYWGLSRGFRALGLRNPVGRFRLLHVLLVRRSRSLRMRISGAIATERAPFPVVP